MCVFCNFKHCGFLFCRIVTIIGPAAGTEYAKELLSNRLATLTSAPMRNPVSDYAAAAAATYGSMYGGGAGGAPPAAAAF